MAFCDTSILFTPFQIRSINDEANVWMQRGIALLQSNHPPALNQAIDCFDTAIRLRLPILESGGPWILFGFCAGWMNRADALTRLGGEGDFAQAVGAYDIALQHLAELEMGLSPEIPRRITIAWINRGLTLQHAERHEEATLSFERALGTLELPESEQITDRKHLQAGAWMNLGISASALKDFRRALEASQASLGVLSNELTDSHQFEIGLKSRHLLCRAIALQQVGYLDYEQISEATDAVEEGLRLAAVWEARGSLQFQTLCRELFHFGCRIYQIYQPQFLGEFIVENFRESGMRAAAQEALWKSLAQLHRSGFPMPGSPEFTFVQSGLRDLVAAEKKINAPTQSQ